MWNLDHHYYQTMFEVGPQGEMMALLHVDSCFLLCENVGKIVSKSIGHTYVLDKDGHHFYKNACEGDQTFVHLGNKMMTELDEALIDQSEQKKIIWKGSVMHHMLFGLYNVDYGTIVDDLLPLLKKFNYDLQFNGHDHHMTYSYTPSREDTQYFQK